MNAAGLNALPRNSRRAGQVAKLLSGLRTVKPVANFVRVMGQQWASTQSSRISASAGLSRFSPVNAGKINPAKFTILYGASDLATAAYETIVRNRFDLDPARVLKPADYQTKCAVNISTRVGRTLSLLDLRNGNAIRSGVPTDVVRCSNHKDGQHFSEFVHRQMSSIDGLLYSSRFTGIACIGVYNRAFVKLTSGASPLPLSGPVLTAALANWNITVT